MIRFKYFLLPLIVFVLSACVKADKQKPIADSGGSQKVWRMGLGGQIVDVTGYRSDIFNSDDIELLSVKDISVKDRVHAQYPNARQYRFKMCVSDLWTNQPLHGTKFMLYSELNPDGKLVEVDVKDSRSCVFWDEVIRFNYLANSVNLKVNFVFKTASDPKAYIHKQTMLNPWDKDRGNNPEFVDFTRTGISDEFRQQSWADGPENIEMALAGKLEHTTKKLIVGSFSRTLVDKKIRTHNFVQALPEEDASKLLAKEGIYVEEQGISAQQHRNEVITLRQGKDKEKEFYQTLDLQMYLYLNDIQVRLHDSAGNWKFEKLPFGRYEINAQIVATDINSEMPAMIITKDTSINHIWSASDYGVMGRIPISVELRPTWGNLALVLKVAPKDFPDIEPFEAIYHLGRFDELAQSGSANFNLGEYIDRKSIESAVDVESFSYDKYLSQSKDYNDLLHTLGNQYVERDENGDPVQIIGLQREFQRFDFGTLDILFGRVMPGDTATDRTIQYTVESCVTDAFTGRKLGPNNVFEITTEDRGIKTTVKAATRPDGCLTWYGMISHKYYHREDLIKKVSEVKFLGDEKMPPYKLAYYINPWDEKFTFGRDARVLQKELLADIKEQQKYAPVSRILITDFHYTTIGFRYEIDKYMNLTVKKSVLLEMKPFVLKYNSIIYGRSGVYPIRDGVYLMKVALQKDYLDPAPRSVHHNIYRDKTSNKHKLVGGNQNLAQKEYLMIKEKLVRVLGGKIITPIQFEISDLRLMRIRNHFLIQLETIDENMLRKLAKISEKLDEEGGNALQNTTEVIDLMNDKDAAMARLEQHKLAADNQFYQEAVNEIMSKYEEKVKKVLDKLDKENLALALEKIDILRRAQQSPGSVIENIRYNILNQTLRILNKFKSNYVEKSENLANEYQVRTENECRARAEKLRMKGLNEEAEKNMPGAENCPVDIPQDQMFYHLTSRSDLGSDQWVRDLLNDDEDFQLYKSGKLLEDFTVKSYEPDYNFDFLSNQGDERNPERFHEFGLDPSEDEVNPYVSGLDRRTFVGPLTILPSDNGSAIRPTDVLGESDCQFDFTCSQLSNIETRDLNQSIVEDLEKSGLDIKNFNKSVNGRYENSPYFGSVKHFKDKQVNDLIANKIRLDAKTSLENKFSSQLSNYLNTFKIDYVSLTNRSSDVKDVDFECYMGIHNEISQGNYDVRLEECMNSVSSHFKRKEGFIQDLLNHGRKGEHQLYTKLGISDAKRYNKLPELSMKHIKEFVKNGVASDQLSLGEKMSFLHRMCFVLKRQFMSHKKFMDKNGSYMARSEQLSRAAALYQVERRCHETLNSFGEMVKESMPAILAEERAMGNELSERELEIKALSRNLNHSPMILERKVRVKETSGEYFYKDGKSLNYNVGANFSMSYNLGFNRSQATDPAAILGLLKDIPGIAAVGSYKVSWSRSEGQSESNGTSINEGTYLAAQISTLDIELKKWEKCSVIRLRPEFQLEMLDYLEKGLNAPSGERFYEPTRDVSGIGYMICSGEDDTVDDMPPLGVGEDKPVPLRIRERYVYFTQHFTEGDMQDPASLVNHPWMLQLRGVRDYANFVTSIKGDRGYAFNYSQKNLVGLTFNDLYDIVKYAVKDEVVNEESQLAIIKKDDLARPINMLADAYRKVLPTFPGLYTFVDSEGERVTNWPADEDHTAHESFDK